MRAVVTTGHGGLDKLEYREDIPVPDPEADEVLVKVSACGLNNTDIWVRQGAYGTAKDPDAVTGTGRTPHQFPLIQGGDVVGCVEKVGATENEHLIGQRVLCNFMTYECVDGEVRYSGSLGNSRDGGYAEYVTVPVSTTYPVDVDWSDAELATIPCAYMTAEHMLETATVSAGETVLVTGASGGVGTALIQLAHAREARVIAVTSTAKRSDVETLNPESIVDRTNHSEWCSLTESIDVVADVVAGDNFSVLLDTLKMRGRYVTAGAIGGAVVPFDVRTLYLKSLIFYGVSVGMPSHFERVLKLIEAGQIRPLLHKTYPLSDIHKAQTDFMNKIFFGNLVVVP